MLIYIVLALLGLLVVFLAVVAMKPGAFRITRSATFSAPASAVFAQVNDFHRWEAWSPWAKMDPDARNTFAGTESGKGAIFSWAGNNKVGEGMMTLIESRPNELIRIQLDFKKPFQATNIAEFTFKTEGGQTSVTWSMTGQNNFMCKAFGMLMNMDKMVGGQFEAGLASMKAIVEQAK